MGDHEQNEAGFQLNYRLGEIANLTNAFTSYVGPSVNSPWWQYDLAEPGQLLKLLVVMTRHKLANQQRRHRAERRDIRRLEPLDPADLEGRPIRDPSPSRMVAGRELLEEFRRRLSDEERLLADLRADGCDWAEIAARLGGTAEACRKQLARAIDRVDHQLERSEIGDG